MNLDREVILHIIEGEIEFLRAENVNLSLLEDVETKSLFSYALGYLEKNGNPPSLTVLAEEFPDLTLEEDEKSETDVPYLAEKLRDRYVRNNKQEILKELNSAPPTEFVEKMSDISSRLWLVTSKEDNKVSIQNFKEVIERKQQSILENQHIGHTFGFNGLDKYTGGVRAGHLAVFAASPKRFKTWFLINAFIEQLRAGERPIFFTLELSADELMERVLCLISGVSYNDFYRGTLMPKSWKRLEKAAEEFASIAGNGLVVQPPLDKRTIDSFNQEVKRHSASCVLVDQLSFVQWTGNHFKENEGYKEIIYDMKNSATGYKIPWIINAQMNRENDESAEMPRAQQLGLTRAIEEASDLVMILRRTQEMKDEGKVQLVITEARHCDSGHKIFYKVELTHGCSFTELV